MTNAERNKLIQLCKQQKVHFEQRKYDGTSIMLIHCYDNLSKYNTVLAMAHKIGRFAIRTETDFTWKFNGVIMIAPKDRQCLLDKVTLDSLKQYLKQCK